MTNNFTPEADFYGAFGDHKEEGARECTRSAPRATMLPSVSKLRLRPTVETCTNPPKHAAVQGGEAVVNSSSSEVLATPELIQLIASFSDPYAAFRILKTVCGSAKNGICTADAWEAFTKNIIGEDAPLPPTNKEDTEEGRIGALKANFKVLLDRLRGYREGTLKLGDGPKGDRNVKALVLAAVTNDGMVLSSADPRLQADRDIVLAAVTQNWNVFDSVRHAFKEDREIVLAAVTQNWHVFADVHPAFADDREIVLAAVAQSGYVFAGLADPALMADSDVVRDAVTKNGLALAWVDAFKADPAIVLAAVSQNGRALVHADNTLKADREIVLAAVTQDAYALTMAAPSLQFDPGFVRDAAAQNGWILRWIDDTLKADRDIVLEAVTQDGLALQYADPALQSDKEIVRVAVANNGRAIVWAAPLLALALLH